MEFIGTRATAREVSLSSAGHAEVVSFRWVSSTKPSAVRIHLVESVADVGRMVAQILESGGRSAFVTRRPVGLSVDDPAEIVNLRLSQTALPYRLATPPWGRRGGDILPISSAESPVWVKNVYLEKCRCVAAA